MFKKREGSTGQLLEFCGIYFVAYVFTGLLVKYFTGKAAAGLVGMSDMQFLVYNTTSSVILVSFVTILLGWYRFATNHYVSWGSLKFPVEFLYIIPSGVCTAVVIPTTTLMYMLPISVMVAMVIMRGSVIVISRVVDAIQIQQGILKKKVYWEENVAVVFAILAVAMNVFLSPAANAFDFVKSPAALTILGSYIAAYSIRIYIMNYYKNTRGKDVKQDNKGFFTIEQFAAAGTMFILGTLLYFSPSLFGWEYPQVQIFRNAFSEPHEKWVSASFSGIAYGVVAFVSVFIFMFKGRTATFAGLVNRLTSLVAGTASTLIFYYAFGGKFPGKEDWVSLVSIFMAVAFLSKAEKKRAKELELAKEL